MQLLRDPSVVFAGYRMPHPLEMKMRLKIQTKPPTNPSLALTDAINSLKNELKHLDEQFEQAVNQFREQQSASAMDY